MTKTFLRSVTVTDGFLENCPVEFSPGLTCIIGARGTCKSTLVETIRFAFDADPEHLRLLTSEREDDGSSQHPMTGMIRETLRAGTVVCHVADDASDRPNDVTIERELDAAPRVYRDSVREHTDPHILQQIEIYSQGDLQRIVEDEAFRIRLIDRPSTVKISALQGKKRDHANRLAEIGPQLRQIRSQVASLEQELRNLPELQAQLAAATAIRPSLPTQIETFKKQYDNRQEAIAIIRKLSELIDTIERYVEPILDVGRDIDLLARQLANTPDVASTVIEGIRRVQKALTTITSANHEIQKVSFAKFVETVEKEIEIKNQPYYDVMKQQKSISEHLKREEHLRRQINQMAELEKRLDVARKKAAELQSQRQTLRAQLAHLAEEIYSLRLAEVEQINAQHGSLILLNLDAGSHTADYAGRIEEMLGGSRIRGQDEVARQISEEIPSGDLIDIVEAGDAQKLAELLQRDLGQMTRIISHLADQEQLYELEVNIPEDRLSVTMFDEGVPKPLETLSKGQKATALLPLILRHLPYPLVFDQPEDDLDNKFIIQSVVDTVRELKERRQLIFVTHNANIPVLGDADRVIVMSMASAEKAGPPIVGSVDETTVEILDLLEGGAEAFQLRQRRYSGHLGKHAK